MIRITEAEYHELTGQSGHPPASSRRREHPWAGKSTGGYREDLGHACRSKWEANLARFYRWVGQPYFYEPCEFWFPIERGIRTYTPDFWLPKEDVWVEVKGFMDQRSRVKIKRFRKYYPDECLQIIDASFFAILHRDGVTKLIEGWE